MRKLPMVGLRVAGLMAMALFIAHCGDSSVHINAGGTNPTAGTFSGTTGDGGAIEIDVASIERIVFDCEDETISQNFDPPVRVVAGDFVLDFRDGGRRFLITGHFSDNDHVSGDIDDGDNHCDTSFEATRNGTTPGKTRTPGAVITPTGGVTIPATETPIGGETSTPGPGGETVTPTQAGPTATSVTPTATGSTPTRTGSTPTPTGPTPCPSKLTLEGQGESADLDTGFTGNAVNQKVIAKGTLTVALQNCGSPGACTNCQVKGPIKSTTVVNNLRNINDPSMECTASEDPNAAIPAGCAYFFGAPLPLTAGGVQSCVLNRVNGPITGTANIEAGTGTSTVTLVSHVVLTSDGVDRPCPRCVGSGGASIGFNQTGTCDLGVRMGQPCKVHGTSSTFGNTSLDCPPSGATSDINIALNPTTGTSSLPIGPACEQTVPAVGNCYCAGQNHPNDCNNGVCNDTGGNGQCQTGPNDTFCSVQTFRPCFTDNDCPAGSGTCTKVVKRGCQGHTNAQGMLDQPISRTGTPGTQTPTLVSTFCIPQVAQPAINTAAGLPGPGALKLPSKVCYASSCTF